MDPQTVARARAQADSFRDLMPQYPESPPQSPVGENGAGGPFRGRGVVMVGGGLRYFVPTWRAAASAKALISFSTPSLLPLVCTRRSSRWTPVSPQGRPLGATAHGLLSPSRDLLPLKRRAIPPLCSAFSSDPPPCQNLREPPPARSAVSVRRRAAAARCAGHRRPSVSALLRCCAITELPTREAEEALAALGAAVRSVDDASPGAGAAVFRGFALKARRGSNPNPNPHLNPRHCDMMLSRVSIVRVIFIIYMRVIFLAKKDFFLIIHRWERSS